VNKSVKETKIILVKPFSRSVYGYPTTPLLGLGLLASILIKAGFETKVLDLRLKGYGKEHLLDAISDFRPHIVGFSASSFDYLNSVELCQAIKAVDQNIVTVIGGPHPTMSPEKAVEAQSVDFICIGEADTTIAEFAEAFPDKEKMKKVRGFGYKKGDRCVFNRTPDHISDLDSLPFIDMGLFPLEKYKVGKILTIPLFTSRGCPYNCCYCCSYLIHGRKYRSRSAESLVQEIEMNMQRFDTKYFTIADDAFNFDKQRVIDFCNLLIEKNLQIEWDCPQGIRADKLTPDIAKLMKKSGCKLLAMGIESVDPEVLKSIKKGETIEQIKEAIKATNEAGIISKAFFLVGLPGDNVEKVRESIKFFKENRIYIPRYSMIVAYPTTDLEKWIKENANLYYDPYDYVTTHNECTDDIGVQFDTKDFPQKERYKIFQYAEKEAEIWLIRNKLIDKFGLFVGRLLVLPFHFKIFRDLLRLAFKLNIINVYS
jgi:anaerobic magnesium-protoporphyrin IX monomethyl ester cyclase